MVGPLAQGDSYLPDSANRAGIGLCLSGGGYRATLFHLGALRRLNEADILRQCRTISSVSGGSIIAAHLASAIQWPRATRMSPDEWDRMVALPIRRFTRENIRTWPILSRILNPTKWFAPATAVEAIAERYRRDLTQLQLRQLPQQPNFVLCATDMAFGVNWVFEGTRVGDYQAGYVSPPPDWPLARAVAASACFPPVFDPMPIALSPGRFQGGDFSQGPERDKLLSDLRLTDGGNYDNLGLEPVWKQHQFVLVSDGGALFEREPDLRILWRRLTRYIAISDGQAHAVRQRWLIASFKTNVMAGTYWGIGGARSSYDPTDTTGYSKALATEVIAKIRTDLDAFSDAEAAVLENHGYMVTDAALRKHVPQLLAYDTPPVSPPHPNWLVEPQVRQALARSSTRTILGRW